MIAGGLYIISEIIQKNSKKKSSSHSLIPENCTTSNLKPTSETTPNITRVTSHYPASFSSASSRSPIKKVWLPRLLSRMKAARLSLEYLLKSPTMAIFSL